MIVSFCSSTSAPSQNVCRAWVGGNALLYHHRLYLVSPQQPTARETKIVVYNLASGGCATTPVNRPEDYSVEPIPVQ